MPTYQYSCTECGHFFEQFQTFSEASLTTCPECSGRLRKVFNAVGVVFKGSGFYRTDSRNDTRAGVGTSGSSAGAGKESGSKESGGKESGSKDAGSKDAPKKSDSSSDSSKSGSKNASSESAA